MKPLDTLSNFVRKAMRVAAGWLNHASGGALSPNTVTITGLLAHLPIAWLIAQQHLAQAAVLLVIFGLFDTLDGELARLQHRASAAGMVLDATTDRMKEVLLYSGVAYAVIASGQPYAAVWAVLACGASLLVSYVKAKGETAIASTTRAVTDTNRTFQDGLGRFEIRMALLVASLLFDQLAWGVMVIALLSWFTALQRLVVISRKLS